MFDEGNMKGVEDSLTGGVPQSIGLGMRCITDQDAGHGLLGKL